MPRMLQRKLLGAFAGSMVSLTLLIENRVLTPSRMRLYSIRRRFNLLRYGMEYEGFPDDIFVVTYPKSGTTWLQMIVYQLTTDGAVDFDHISDVSPHLEETMIPRRQKISDLRRTPRILKSHLHYHEIPKGPGRYIYCIRNGLDVAVSYHHHARKYIPGWGQMPQGEFFSRFMAGEVPYGSWFENVAGWLRNKDRLNVLVVTYEELRADLEAGVKQIADFCGIAIDPADMPRILERCSFAFMREHDAKFSIGGPPPPEAGQPPAGLHSPGAGRRMAGGTGPAVRERISGGVQAAAARPWRRHLPGPLGPGRPERRARSDAAPAGGLSSVGQSGGASHNGS